MADLLYAGVLEKFTGEQFDEDFDFSGVIPEGTTVASATVTVINANGSDATPDVFVSKSIATTIVTVTLNTGSTETAYIVKVTVAASDATPALMVKLMHVTSPGVYR